MRKCDWLFPTPVMVSKLKDKDADLEICRDLIIESVKDDPVWSKKIHATTQDTLHHLPPFKKLVNAIHAEVSYFCNEMLLMDANDLELVSMWANTHKGPSTHVLHMHANSFVSGVVYLQVPENVTDQYTIESGKLSFEDPRECRHVLVPDHYDQNDAKVEKQRDYETQEGDLILFPSWLKHRVHPFDSGKEFRVSLSFNYMLTKSSVNTRSFNLF